MQKYFFNSFWMLSEQALRIVAGVFVGIYVARYLGPEKFGVLSYVTAISTFVLALTRLGMDAVLVRELADFKKPSNVLLGTAFWLMVSAAVFSYLLVASSIWSLEDDGEIRLYIIILCSSAFFSSFLVADYFFQSNLKSKFSSACKAVTLLLISVAKLAFIFLQLDLFWFVVVSLIEHVILASLLVLVMRAYGGLKFISFFDVALARSMLNSAWPMVITAVAALIYMRIDQVMIRNMLGLYEVGIYSAAVKIYESWIIFPYVLTISLLPLIVRLKQGSEGKYNLRITQLFSFLIWLSIFAAVVVTLFSEYMMVLAFGEAYRESASVVNIVMWTAVFASIGSVSARYLNVERMERKIAFRTLVAAVFNVGFNYLLIPLYGINGAAVATLLSNFIAHYLLDWFDSDLHKLLKIKHEAFFPFFRLKRIFNITGEFRP